MLDRLELKFKSRVNRFYAKRIGGNQRPTFFNIDEICPALHDITANFSTIQAEFSEMLKHVEHIPQYHDLDPNQAEISNMSEQQWRVFMLSLFGHYFDNAQNFFPKTCEQLHKIPNLMQAFFSILDPGKSIPLHEGPYMGYLRYHLGIEVPKEDPPQIIINKQPHVWEEGNAVLFDDSWPHEVVNHSQERRVVLIIDILRPMPWLPNLINQMVINGLAKYTYGLKVRRRAHGYGQQAKPIFQ